MADTKWIPIEEFYERGNVPEYARVYPETYQPSFDVPVDRPGDISQQFPQFEQVSDYWLQPENVAKYYNMVSNNQREDWMDDSFVDFINQAYGLYEIANQGASWENWLPFQLDDPARQYLGLFGPPPEQEKTPQQKVEAYLLDEDSLYKLPPEEPREPVPYVTVEPNQTTGGISREEYMKLPWGQRMLYQLTSSPNKSGAAIGGLFGAVSGGIPGAVAGTAMGAGLGALAERFPIVQKMGEKLDILAEGVERFIGTVSLLTGKDVKSFDDLKAAWQAGHLAYDVARFTEEQIINPLEMPVKVEWDDKELLHEAYVRIRDGEDPEKVYESINERTGFSGQLRNMMGHIIFDPLHLTGWATSKTIGKGANVASGIEKLPEATRVAARVMETAADNSHGLIQTIQRYGVALRSNVPVDTIKDMGWFSRWLGNVDKAGNVTFFNKPAELTGVLGAANRLGGAALSGGMTGIVGLGFGGPVGGILTAVPGAIFGGKKGLSYLVGLTPASKALEVVDMSSRNFAQIIDAASIVKDGVRYFDDAAKYNSLKYLKTMANTPNELAEILGMQSILAPEAAGIPHVLNYSIPKIQTMLDTWHKTGTARTVLTKIAEMTGRTADDILALMQKSVSKNKTGKTIKPLNNLFFQLTEEAKNTNNKLLLEMIADGSFTEKSFRKMFKTFIKDGNPATDNAYLARMHGIIMEDSATWAATWFNVKPDPAVIRMSQMLKNAQSLLVLGLNPTYLVNNFINNIATMAADNVFSFRTTKQIKEFWARMGIEPSRLYQGVTPIGDTDVAISKLGEFTKADDTLQKVSDIMHESPVQKLGILNNVSQKFESFSSAISKTEGTIQAMRKIWKPGKGFDPLPIELQQILGPELTEYVHNTIKSGLNKSEIENSLWSGYAYRTVNDIVPNITKRVNMNVDDINQILSSLKLDDFLEQKLKGDLSIDQINKIFNEAHKHIDDTLDNLIKQASEFEAQHIKTRLNISGAVDVIDILADQSVRMEVTEIMHWAANERINRMIEQTPGLTQQQINALWSNHYLVETKRYSRLEQIFNSQLQGLKDAVDTTDPLGKSLVDLNTDWYNNWKSFFKKRNTAIKKVFGNKPEWTFDQYESEMLKLYEKHIGIEQKTETKINNVIIDMIRRQFGDNAANEAKNWRDELFTMRQGIRDGMTDLRKNLAGKNHTERTKLWSDFLPNHKKALFDYYQENFSKAKTVYEQTRKANKNNNVPNAGIGMPMGYGDKLMSEPPLFKIIDEGWHELGIPILEELRAEYINGKHKYGQTIKDFTLEASAVNMLKEYLGKVYGQLGDAKNLANRYGDYARDFALLNYQKRYGFDTILSSILPYQFWYTRSMLNWGIRALDRPGYVATWMRIRDMQNLNKKEGYPSRLAGKIQIQLPQGWLPDFMGDSIYIDPLRQLFPIELMLDPFNDFARDDLLMNNRTRYILEDWAGEERYPIEEIENAIQTKSGPIWDEAKAQAKLELDSEYNNPFDFMRAITGPLLPLEWAYQLAQGKPEDISALPPTRMVQALTAWVKPGGMNIEEKLREALGLPTDMNKYWDYYIRREIVWAGFMQGLSYEEIVKAMADRTGPLYMQALDQVGKRQSVRYFASSAALDFYPEGEKEIRALQDEYRLALENDNVQEFYDRHPEWGAKTMMHLDDPEELIRKVAIAAIWKMREELPRLAKQRLEEGFGEEYKTSFLNKETRSYDAIETEMLLGWARAMGAELPNLAKEYTGDVPQIDIGSPEENAAYEAYYQERDAKFGADIGNLSFQYSELPDEQKSAFLKQHPELQEYWEWKKQYRKDNPLVDNIMGYTEESLRSFVINEIWQRKNELEPLVKKRLENGFGDAYKKYFINKDTRDYDKIPTEQLLGWASAMGIDLPEAAQEYKIDVPQVNIGSPDEIKLYSFYLQERERLFGKDITNIQSRYYALPKDNRKAFLNLHPELEQYWNWNRGMKQQYPKLEEMIKEGQEGSLQAFQVNIEDFSQPLINRLLGYYYSGQPLGGGAKAEIERIWRKYDKPTKTLDEFIELLRSYFR